MDRLACVRYGLLCSSELDGARVDPADAFSVLVLWDHEDVSSWLGWVTTSDRRAVAFRAPDISDAGVRHWLEALPAWSPERFASAVAHAGMHQVWRRPVRASLLPSRQPERAL